MQADPPDTTAVPTSSPPLSPFRPRAGLTHEGVHLRRATVAPQNLQIHLSLPYADLGGSPASWSVHPSTTVREAKVAIASGSAGYGRWEAEAMRLIYRGRLLKDDEVLEGIFHGVDEPTVHVVARPLSPQMSTSSLPAVPVPTPTPTPTRQPSSTSADAVALTDTIHYLLFTCREHLCAILGRPPLAWENTYPAPVISRPEAREAILSVVRAYAGDDWAAVIASEEGLEQTWEDLGREIITEEVSGYWISLVGREYATAGDVAPIELDSTTFNLHLPPLKDMVPAQLTHLLFYLRAASLVRFLSGCLAEVEATQVAAAPAAAQMAPVPAQVANPVRMVYQTSFRLRVPLLSIALLTHQFWSAVRLLTILWMLTRGMSWKDNRFWFLAAGAGCWWVVDGYNQWVAENRVQREARRRRAARQPRPATEGGQQDGNVPLDAAAQAAADAPVHAAAAARAGAAGIRPRQGGARRPQGAEWVLRVPLFHLEEDAYQLRLASRPTNANRGGVNQSESTELGPEPRSRPNGWITNALLPAYLWFLTLIPAFEASRARLIRQRERSMRAIVTSMNPEDHQNDGADAEAEGTEGATPRHDLVLPTGLSYQARKYYTRVAESSEMIDWEAERDAQRAMGIPDEDEGAAAGAGFMGLL